MLKIRTLVMAFLAACALIAVLPEAKAQYPGGRDGYRGDRGGPMYRDDMRRDRDYRPRREPRFVVPRERRPIVRQPRCRIIVEGICIR